MIDKKREKGTIVGDVSEMIKKVELFEHRRMQRYRRNLYYLSGNQWLKYNGDKYYLPDFDPYNTNKEPVSNMLINSYLINLSKFTRSFPGYYSPATTGDKEDRDSSEMAQNIMDYLVERLEMEEMNIELWSWLLALGTVFMKSYYNKNTDKEEDQKKIPIPETKMENVSGYICVGCGYESEYQMFQCHQCGMNEIENGMIGKEVEVESGKYETINFGNQELEVVPPMNIIVPLYATSIKNTDRLIHRRFVHIEEIRNKWGKKADKIIPGNDSSRLFEIYGSTINEIMSDGFGYENLPMVSTKKENTENMCVYNEYYERVSKVYPNGYYAVLCNDVVVHEQDKLEYPIEEQFYKFDFVKITGHFWSFGIVDLGINHQDKINGYERKISLGLNANMFPEIFAPRGINMSRVESSPDSIIEYDEGRGEKPYRAPGLGMPADVYRMLEEAKMNLNIATFNVDVRQGQPPQGVESGVAIKALKEEADTALYNISARYERTMVKLMNFMLREFRDNNDDERMLKIVGKDNRIKLINFRGSKIKDFTDIRIKPGSSFPQSIVGKQEMLLSIEARGLLGNLLSDPRKLDTFLGYFGIKENFIKENNIDVEEAENENYLILEKEDFKVGYFNKDKRLPQSQFKTITDNENYFIHLLIHQDETKRASFNDKSNEAKQFLLSHIEETKQAAQAQAIQQMQNQGVQQKPAGQSQPQGQVAPMGINRA